MDDLDRRTNAARLALETQDAIISDLGGEGQLSTLERLAAQHAALAAAVVNDAYTRWLKGEEVSLPELATVQLLPAHCRHSRFRKESQGRNQIN